MISNIFIIPNRLFSHTLDNKHFDFYYYYYISVIAPLSDIE